MCFFFWVVMVSSVYRGGFSGVLVVLQCFWVFPVGKSHWKQQTNFTTQKPRTPRQNMKNHLGNLGKPLKNPRKSTENPGENHWKTTKPPNVYTSLRRGCVLVRLLSFGDRGQLGGNHGSDAWLRRGVAVWGRKANLGLLCFA